MFPPFHLPDDFVELTIGASTSRVPEAAPVLPLTERVLFPGCPARLWLQGTMKARVLASVGREQFREVVALPWLPDSAQLRGEQFYKTGSVCQIRALKQESADSFMSLVEAGPRCEMTACTVDERGYMLATLVARPESPCPLGALEKSKVQALQEAARRALISDIQISTWTAEFLKHCDDAAVLAGCVAPSLGLSVGAQIQLLEEDPQDRVGEVLWLMERGARR